MSIALAIKNCRKYVTFAAIRLHKNALRAIRYSRAIGKLRPYARWIGITVAVIVVAGSFAALFNLLKDLDPAEVAAALRAYPPERLVLAAAFIVCAYVTLTFYDWFALKTIGATGIPYRIAAMASFTSYSIGHNVGATAFSGGAIRYRIYSSWGLTALDVAKICFVTGLTFWLGNLAALGSGMIYAPEAASQINQLPPWLNRAFGTGALLVLAGYVIWASCADRRIGRDNWTLALPGRTSILVQIAIGIVDLTCCSLAMYILMPSEPRIEFATVAVIFISATLLGFASHSPGSLGVFDAAMMFAFAQVDREDLVAALLLFRLLYFLTPFILALAIVTIRECAIAIRQRACLKIESSSKRHA